MNIRTILIMGIFMSLSWALVRFAAPYQKNIAQKYIVLPNAFLARCLLPKQRGYVKVADRRKISLFSLVFYGLFAVVSIALVLCFLLPDVPCETFTAYFGRKNTRSYEICTWNEKMVYFLPMAFMFVCSMTGLSCAICRKAKQEKLSVKLLVGLLTLPLFFLIVLIVLVIWVF